MSRIKHSRWVELSASEQWAVELVIDLLMMNYPDDPPTRGPISEAVDYIRCAYGCNTCSGGPDRATFMDMEKMGIGWITAFERVIEENKDNDDDGENAINQWLDDNE